MLVGTTGELAGLRLPSWVCWCQPVFLICQSKPLPLICCKLLWQSERTVTAGKSASRVLLAGAWGFPHLSWGAWTHGGRSLGTLQPARFHTLPGYGFQSICSLSGKRGRKKRKRKKAYSGVRRARSNLCYDLICIMNKIASFMHDL